jgi:hypothetical protein
MTWRRSSSLLVSLVAVLLIPSTATRFDGLPLSSIPEAFALAVLLPLIVSTAHRRLLNRTLTRCPSRVWLALLGTVLAGGALKLALAPARPAGFLACYESTLMPPPAGRCERSFENPFFRYDATRIDPAIDFGPDDWDLSFLNSLRFNFYPWVAGLRRRDRVPLKVAWRGVVESDRQDAVVTYVGQGIIGVDAASIDLPRAYDAPATVSFQLPPGRHLVRVFYTFDDGSMTRERRQLGPYATLRLTTGADGEARAPLRAVPAPAGVRLAGAALDALVLGVSFVLLGYYVRLLRFQRRPIAALGLAFAAIWLAGRAVALPAYIGVTLVSWSLLPFVLGRNRSTRLLLAYFVLLLMGVWLALGAYPRLSTVVYRSAGDDWYTYESFARTILETWSLEAGERVFYTQPLFRYIRFAEHFLLGDADPLINLLGWTALHWTVFWAASALRGTARVGRARAALFGLAAALTLALAGSVIVVTMMQLSLSEHVTWIFLAAAFALLGGRTVRGWPAGAAFLGAAVITRPNQAPALVCVAIAFLGAALWQRRRVAFAAAAVFLAVCLLPLAHNLYYGGSPVIFTTTAIHPATAGVPVATLARVTSDTAARAEVVTQVRALMFLPPGPSRTLDGERVKFVLYGLLGVWLAALCLAVGGRVPANRRLLALVPALYLAVHVVYDVRVYYPRHILAAYFGMGLVAMAIAGSRFTPASRATSSSRAPAIHRSHRPQSTATARSARSASLRLPARARAARARGSGAAPAARTPASIAACAAAR